MVLKKVLIGGLLALATLILGLSLFNLAFEGSYEGMFRTNLTYYITQSGGPVGTAIGIVLACLLYTIREKGWRNKVMVFAKAMLGLVLFISLFAALNEKFTKPLLKKERPSHHEMLSRLQMNNVLDSLYGLSKQERVAFFGMQVGKRRELFKNIDPKVLQHWIEEGGYSFPSGHSFNAFLLAMIFSFGIARNNLNEKTRRLFFIPFVWAVAIAISRVAIGAHDAYDVSAGAAMGVALGGILLYLDFTRHWVTHKQQD